MSFILMRNNREYLDFSELDGMPIVSNTFYEFETKKQAKSVQSTLNSLLEITNKKPFELYSITKETTKKASSKHEVEIEE